MDDVFDLDDIEEEDDDYSDEEEALMPEDNDA
jgi:hypothetical protein